MDANDLADRLEPYWDEWHAAYEHRVVQGIRIGEEVADPLESVRRNARDLLEVFDEWKSKKDVQADARLQVRIQEAKPQWNIGKNAFVDSDLGKDASYTWTPYTLRMCIRSRIEGALELCHESDDFRGGVWKMICNSFVRALRRSGMDLDHQEGEDQWGTSPIQTGNFPALAPIGEGVQPNATQERLIWDNLALMTYGFLARANRNLVKVPFVKDEVPIVRDREQRPFCNCMKEYLKLWMERRVPIIGGENSDTRWVYAAHNNRIVGFTTGYIGKEPREYDWVKIDGMAVSGNYQGSGVGKSLLFAFTESVPRHTRRLIADVVPSSLPFWLSQGFQEKGSHMNCTRIEKVLDPHESEH